MTGWIAEIRALPRAGTWVIACILAATGPDWAFYATMTVLLVLVVAPRGRIGA